MANYSLSAVLSANTSNFVKNFKKANSTVKETKKTTQSLSGKLKKFGGGLNNVGNKLTTHVTLPIMAVGAGMVKAAADLEATEAKYATVFKGFTKESDAFLKKFKELTPATKAEARSMASGIQDLLVPMGFARKEATKFTGKTMHLVGALTNFNSATHSAQDVQRAFSSALTGSYEPLKALGIQVNKKLVQEKAVQMGLAKTTKEVTKNMEAQALLKLSYEQSGDALAAYNKESLDTKTKAGLLRAKMVDLGAKLGEKLLPHVTKLVEKITDLVDWFDNLSPGIQDTIIKTAAFAAAAGPALKIVGGLTSGIGTVIKVGKGLGGMFKLASGGAKLFGGAMKLLPMLFNPVTLGIGAVVAAGVLIYKNWDKIKAGAKKLWRGIKKAWSGIKNATAKVWKGLKSTVSGAWEGVKSVTKGAVGGLVGMVKGYYGGLWNIAKSGLGLVKDVATGNWGKIAENTKKTIQDMKTKITEGWASIKRKTAEKWKGIRDTINRWLGRSQEDVGRKSRKIEETMSKGATGAATGVLGGMKELNNNITKESYIAYAKARTAGAKIKKGVKDGMKGTPTSGSTLISQVVAGIWESVKKKLGSIWEAGKRIGSNLWNGAKKALGIHSPSRKFAWVTDMSVLGLIKQADKSATAVKKSGQKLGDNFYEGYNSSNMIGEVNRIKGNVKSSVNHSINDFKLTKVSQPATVVLNLGKRAYTAFIDDISNAQDSIAELELNYV